MEVSSGGRQFLQDEDKCDFRAVWLVKELNGRMQYVDCTGRWIRANKISGDVCECVQGWESFRLPDRNRCDVAN